MISVNKLEMECTNYPILIGINDDLDESLFAKWVIDNYDENALHEWIMHLLSNTIDIEDMEGTFRKHE